MPKSAAIIASGTYLRGKIFIGDISYESGPDGMFPSVELAQSLKNLGVLTRRFKTGTPARIDKRSIDFSKMEEQFGDEVVTPFSFTTNPDDVQIEQASSCFRHPLQR